MGGNEQLSGDFLTRLLRNSLDAKSRICFKRTVGFVLPLQKSSTGISRNLKEMSLEEGGDRKENIPCH